MSCGATQICCLFFVLATKDDGYMLKWLYCKRLFVQVSIQYPDWPLDTEN